MLWGKKILEWSSRPPKALDQMKSLMDRFALDGRDPNSYAGYGWVLGRYDRPWPRRPIFGTVRYMSSASAKRKLKMKQFLERYGHRDDALCQKVLPLRHPPTHPVPFTAQSGKVSASYGGTRCAPPKTRHLDI